MLHSGHKHGFRLISLPMLPVYSCDADSVSRADSSTHRRGVLFRLVTLSRFCTLIIVKGEWPMQKDYT
jgi:hypothetical protein